MSMPRCFETPLRVVHCSLTVACQADFSVYCSAFISDDPFHSHGDLKFFFTMSLGMLGSEDDRAFVSFSSVIASGIARGFLLGVPRRFVLTALGILGPEVATMCLRALFAQSQLVSEI